MTTPQSAPSFHVWIPDMFQFRGGIQVYSKFFLQALQSVYPKADYEVFLKHDTQASTEFSAKTRFYCAGHWPLSLRTVAFAGQLLGHGLRKRPDLVITTHLNFTLAAYWLRRLTGIPYWTVAHGVEAWDIKQSVLRTALRYADKILAVSSYTRDRLLQEQNLSPDKISLLPNTFDLNRFQIATKPTYLLEQHKLKPEQPLILTVARLAEAERYKGYDQILKALPLIRQSIPQVHYIIVGTGDDQRRIEQLIQQQGLQDCVTLAGFVPDHQLADYYNLCDIFAMPSKREGFGIVYLEALACGKPVLGGNQDGATDALSQGKLGALVDPDNAEEIAQTIIQILQKSYPHPLMYQPYLLRRQVIATFGFEQFKQTLASHLESRGSFRSHADCTFNPFSHT
jgi:glycosyltransferase involved in cell wall biosynthesis